ncbi:MAG: sulfotransferase [Candidatus Uhrbacteria bacterium]|nr:sulfotransferase [Candidatus Uhrbacteria bacterium]
MALPNFIIAGAPKCGTTSLADYLSSHPEVFVSNPKEITFFSEFKGEFERGSLIGDEFGVDPLGSGTFYKGWDWYKSQFNPNDTQRAIGEASVQYLYFPDSAEMLYKFMPDIKLIFLLRDPVARVFSEYWHENRYGFKKKYFPSFKEMVHENHPRLQYYIDVSSYKTHLERFFKLFPSEQILVLLSEDLRRDTEGQMNRICKFLNVDPDIKLDFKHESNQAYIPRFRKLQRVMEAVSFTGAVRNLPVSIRRPLGKLKERIRRIGASKSRPELDRALRSELLPQFEEDIRYVEDLLGRDLSSWRSIDG